MLVDHYCDVHILSEDLSVKSLTEPPTLAPSRHSPRGLPKIRQIEMVI